MDLISLFQPGVVATRHTNGDVTTREGRLESSPHRLLPVVTVISVQAAEACSRLYRGRRHPHPLHNAIVCHLSQKTNHTQRCAPLYLKHSLASEMTLPPSM